MAALDRAMLGQLHIALPMMMEHAGRALAGLATERFLDGDPLGKRVTVLAGKGGNGGGALTAARNLVNWGAAVQVVLTHGVHDLSEVTALQLDICRRLSLPIAGAGEVESLPAGQLILDGLVGYSLSGPPRAAAADLVRWANGQPAPTLALDLPTGLDADTGQPFDPTTVAAATLTLALPKVGLTAPGAGDYVGELYLADIGVPPSLVQEIVPEAGAVPPFSNGGVLRLG